MAGRPTTSLQTGLRVGWFFAKYAIAAFIIVLPIRFFIAQPFLVDGNSMVPTFQDGDYLVIDKLSYDVHPPQRGDIVIVSYPFDPSIFLIKRVVGLPGETISYSDNTTTILSPDGTVTTLQEPYIVPSKKAQANSITTLADDEYFVLGDNREQSSDSREWGPLQKRFIVGRAFMRLFPLTAVQILPGKYHF
jgi:signal peptidase I